MDPTLEKNKARHNTDKVKLQARVHAVKFLTGYFVITTKLKTLLRLKIKDKLCCSVILLIFHTWALKLTEFSSCQMLDLPGDLITVLETKMYSEGG